MLGHPYSNGQLIGANFSIQTNRGYQVYVEELGAYTETRGLIPEVLDAASEAGLYYHAQYSQYSQTLMILGPLGIEPGALRSSHGKGRFWFWANVSLEVD
jgi:hypothetical protein